MVLFTGVASAWGTRGECVKPGNTTLFAGKTVPQNTLAIVVSTSFYLAISDWCTCE
jgi:hypothetical protein